MKAVPSLLNLPDGPARLIPGSLAAGAPRYERDGMALDVDVAIPDDLAAAWFWDGSVLRLKTEPDACGVSICMRTFPPPGAVGGRGDCFTQAREIERAGTELDAAPTRQAKVGKRKMTLPDVAIVAIPEPELAYEQVSF